nr:hypothetical protein [Candidatus Sigynarchaeota archaeon]
MSRSVKDSLSQLKGQDEFTQTAMNLFKGHKIDWDKYEKDNPDLSKDDFAKVKESVSNVKGWDTIGYQRVLGGFFYDWGIELVGFFIGALLLPLYILIFIPYPSATGYFDIAERFFGMVYFYFDIGTRYGLERFIGEYRIKNPNKMLGYLQFYIWYQMTTGLVQVTFISTMVLYTLRGSSMEYLAWLFLIICQKQYPGMLGYFHETLRGLQQFKYDNILEFLGGRVFEFATQIIFILLFRWIGTNYVPMGDLMGCAFGAAIGKYVDDFISLAVAMYFFNRVMKPMGITARDCFRTDHIDASIVKTSLWWGLQLSIPGMIGSLLSFVHLLVWLTMLPQYQHWNTIAGLSDLFSGIVMVGKWLTLKAAMAEAYLNGKTELAQYYFANAYKWMFMLMVLFLGLLGVYLPILMGALLKLKVAEQYLLAVPFILPMLCYKIVETQQEKFDDIIVGTDHPTAKTLYELAATLSGTLWLWFNLGVLRWQDHGVNGIIMLYTFAGIGSFLAYLFIRWIFCELHVFHVKIPAWQGLVAPALAALAIVPISLSWLFFVHIPILQPMSESMVFNVVSVFDPGSAQSIAAEWGQIFAILITLLFAVFSSLFLFFFLYAFFGGWDDFGFLVFLKVYSLSGPSKPLVKLLLQITNLGIRASKRTLKLHNKHPIDAAIPFVQSVELLIERQINDFKNAKARASEKAGVPVAGTAVAGKTPRAFLFEFFRDFKTFFTKTTRQQWIGNYFSLVLYSILLSVVAFFWIDASFFTLDRVIIIYVIYLVVIGVIGVGGVSYAVRTRLRLDRASKPSQTGSTA